MKLPSRREGYKSRGIFWWWVAVSRFPVYSRGLHSRNWTELKSILFEPRCEIDDLKVDTGLKSGIYCKAPLITADAAQNGRIIKNLQPISMGVWRRLPVKINQLRLVESRQSLLTLNAHEDREKWNRKRFLFNSVFMSFFLCSHTRSGKLLQWLN